MIDSLGSSSMMSLMQQMQSGQGRKPPTLDQDGSGGLNKTELTEAANAFEKATGKVLNIDEMMAEFDNDGNGEIGQEEFKGYLEQKGFAPPQPPPISTEMLLQMNGGQRPVSMSQGVASYGQNSSEDLLNELITNLFGEDDQSGEVELTA